MREHHKELQKLKGLSREEVTAEDTREDTAEAIVIRGQQNILDWSAKVCHLRKQLGKHIQALQVIVGAILRWEHLRLLVRVLLVMMAELIL